MFGREKEKKQIFVFNLFIIDEKKIFVVFGTLSYYTINNVVLFGGAHEKKKKKKRKITQKEWTKQSITSAAQMKTFTLKRFLSSAAFQILSDENANRENLSAS